MRRLALLLPLLLCAGCGREVPPERVYPPGLARESVRKDRPVLRTYERAGDGTWPDAETAAIVQRRYPDETAAAFRSVDVFWFPRGLLGLGVYWDYVFYGADGKVLATYRKFVD